AISLLRNSRLLAAGRQLILSARIHFTCGIEPTLKTQSKTGGAWLGFFISKAFYTGKFIRPEYVLHNSGLPGMPAARLQMQRHSKTKIHNPWLIPIHRPGPIHNRTVEGHSR